MTRTRRNPPSEHYYRTERSSAGSIVIQCTLLKGGPGATALGSVAGITIARWTFVSERGERQKRGVLIIENEPSVADALRIILEDGGYRVSIALTGRDGIEEARRGEFCLTITDIDLRDMTGFDVINAICRHKPQIHFIIITSSDSEDVIAEARSSGAAGVLLKPFLPSEILQLIRTTLANPQRSGDGEII